MKWKALIRKHSDPTERREATQQENAWATFLFTLTQSLPAATPRRQGWLQPTGWWCSPWQWQELEATGHLATSQDWEMGKCLAPLPLPARPVNHVTYMWGWAALPCLTQSREIPQRYPQRWFYLVYHRERGRIQTTTRGTIIRRSRPAGACRKKAPAGVTLCQGHCYLNSQQMGYFSASLEAAGTSDCTELTEIWRSLPTPHGVTWSQGCKGDGNVCESALS